jgi:hypothetical protein
MAVYEFPLDSGIWFWEHPGMDRTGPFDSESDATEDYDRYLVMHEGHEDPFRIAVDCRKLAEFQRLAADYQELAKAAESVLAVIRKKFAIEGVCWSIHGDWIVVPQYASVVESNYAD